LLVHQGNLVKENDTPALLVIHQIDPVYVSFTLPERSLPEVKRSMAAGPLQVTALIPNADVQPVTGTLTFLDNSVNQRTGTIRLKATFENSQRVLWPGQFVTVRLVVSVHKDAVVAPSEAIQTGQSGSYGYVLRQDSTVELRNVVTGESREGQTIILEGLKAGEVVVTDGHLRLAPDAKAQVVDSTAGAAKG
jgi:multidrug efflux system membrane fusion protein